MSAAVIVLSAGASRRMGQPKALLRLDGRSFLQWVVEKAQALPAAQIVVTLAAPHGEDICKELAATGFGMDLPGLRIAWNAHPELGMLSSVQCALALLLPQVSQLSGALIWPVDIPRVQAQTLQRIVEVAATQPGLVVPTYGGRGGHPLWLPRALFAETLQLPVELGLRALRTRHPPCLLPVDDEEILRDFDTHEDVRRALVDGTENATSARASEK
ncbi:MAG: nucleotidyltransferase family protein [Myxococcales bacterium]|nr:nucleotidyltransferase family protein [Myxococcales bacterium]